MSKFNFNIDVDIEQEQNNDVVLSKSKNIIRTQKDVYATTLYVDMGLPSKTLWAKYNLGVDIGNLKTPEGWYGNYYAWGEIKPKNQYSISTYKFGHDWNDYTKYYTKMSHRKKISDELYELELEDDAAYVATSNDTTQYRTPSENQYKELLQFCYTALVHDYNDVNDLNGYVFISKINNKELFFPASRHRMTNKVIKGEKLAGSYMTSSLNSINGNISYLFFNRGQTPCVSECVRYQGLTIRPVVY